MLHPDVELTDPVKFHQRYQEYTQSAPTYAKAYELAERDHRAIFGKNKYASYNSFRVAASQRLKRDRRRSADSD